MTLATPRDIVDFVLGCDFYSAGTGGDNDIGGRALEKALAEGYTLAADGIGVIRDDAVYCSAFFMGSLAPHTAYTKSEMSANGFDPSRYFNSGMLVQAVRHLEKHLGQPVEGLVASELESLNTACCMDAAWRLGIPVLNADLSGRGIGGITHSLPAILGGNLLPAVYCDAWGNCNINTEATGYLAAERFGKMLSAAAYGQMAAAAYPMRGAALKEVLVPGTLTKALALGRTIRNAAAAGQNPCAAAAAAAGGQLLCHGTVAEVEAEDREGYYTGSFLVAGGADTPGWYKVWFMNANQVLWREDSPLASSPDLVIALNRADARPVCNTEVYKGMEVALLAVPAPAPLWGNLQAAAACGPRSMGFAFDHRPFEVLPELSASV